MLTKLNDLFLILKEKLYLKASQLYPNAPHSCLGIEKPLAS